MSDEFENIPLEPEDKDPYANMSLEEIESRIMELRHQDTLTPDEESEVALLDGRYRELLIENLNKPEP